MWLHFFPTGATVVEKTTPTRTADPRSPLVRNVRDLRRQPGTLLAWRRRLPSPDQFGTDVVGVSAGEPLEFDLRLESVSEGVLVTGTITTTMRGECGRCLDPVAEDVTVTVCELFAYPNSTTDATTEEDEVYRLAGDLLDLEPVVRDTVVLGLPLTLLCRADCPGLCPNCGQRLDDLPTEHNHDTIDPRWAALTHLSMPPS
jgi:DUF177 domain-containing protein